MKPRFHSLSPQEAPPAGERRRMSKIVHDHKGTASVVWQDAPSDHERPILEIEQRLGAGGLAVQTDESHDPYMRMPQANPKSGAGRPKDLRKLSAWIKLMRELEEAKRRKAGSEADEIED